MKPHSSIKVVKKWCSVRTDPVLRCFDNLEGLNNRGMPCWCSLRVRELANGLKPGTTVMSQNLSGAWVTIHG
jgi:hypothetical protein